RLLEVAEVTLEAGLMMPPDRVRAMAEAQMEIGAHTVTHPILNSASDEQARYEIAESKRQLEALLGQEVVSFAYPNGRPGSDSAARHVEMPRAAGFRIAASTAPGSIGRNSDPWQLARIAPWAMGAHALQARLARWYLESQRVVATA